MSRTYRRTPEGKTKHIKEAYPTTPHEWHNTFHERPFRRKNATVCKQILNGYLSPERALYPATHKKPHIYYW